MTDVIVTELRFSLVCLLSLSSNVEQKEEIEYFPWYMVMFYQREKAPEHYIYEVDLSDL